MCPTLGNFPHGLKIAPFEKKSSLHNNGYLPDTVAKLRGGLLLTTSYILDLSSHRTCSAKVLWE